MSTNPFIKIDDDLDAEAWNGAIMMFACLNPLITLNLPSDLDGGAFTLGSVDGEGNLIYTKAGPLITFLTLVNTQITNGTIQLAAGQTSGTATFRIYPNIEPFKSWISLDWDATFTGSGTIQCDIHKVSDGSTIETNYQPLEDLSVKNMGLEFIDFIFTLTKGTQSPVLDDLTLIIKGGL